jgi:hypothetical protein
MPAFKFLSSEPPAKRIPKSQSGDPKATMNPLEQLMSMPNRWPFNFTLLFNPFGGLLNKKALRPHIAFNPPMGDNSLLKPVYQGLQPVLQGRLIGCLRWM